MIRQNRANPSWHARHLENHLSTNPIYHQSFDPLFLLSAPIISAEALRCRLISKPGAREVNPILLLLLPANKRGIKQKSWEMEEEFTDLFVVETDEEKTWGKRESKANWHDRCAWSQGGPVFPLKALLEFLLSQSSLDRGFPLLQLMAEKQEEVSENGW